MKTISSKKAKRIILWLVATTFFMETLDGSVINIAVAPIAYSFHVHPLMLKLVVTSYLLSLGVFIPVSGWMADRFGLRNIYGVAIIIFGIGSLACGLSHSLIQLVIARVIQGMGGAMMNPVGRLLYLREFDRSELVRVTSFIVMPALLGPTLGPLFGGALITWLSWRWIFYINIPFVIIAFVLVIKFVKNYKASNVGRFDWLGFLFLGGGIAFVSFGLVALGQHATSATSAEWLIVVGLLSIIGYFISHRYASSPVINVKIFETHTFKIAMIAGFLTRLGIAIYFLLPLLFQVVFHYSAFKAGAIMSSLTLGAIAAKPVIKYIFHAFPMRIIMVCNGGALALLTVGFCIFTPSTPIYVMLLLIFVYGFFVSIHFSGMQTLNYAEGDRSLISQYTSFGSSMQQIAVSFAVAISAGLLEIFMRLHGTAPVMSLINFRSVFVCEALIVFLPCFIFLCLRRDAAAISTGYTERSI